MSKKTTYIHAENNNKILSSNEVRLYVPPEPEKMKVLIWGKELCNMAEWNDFLKCVEEKTEENNQLKQQLEESFTEKDVEGLIEDRNKTIKFLQKELAEKDKEIEELKTKQKLTFMHSKEDYFQRCNLLEEANIKLQFTQTQLAIQELEKVKEYADKDFRKHCYIDAVQLEKVINQQIKELRGE